MIKDILIQIFSRDLTRLKEEIIAFETDEAMWQEKPGITNTAGTLTLHLVGNLNHFIGHVLGNTAYIRNREFEFSARNISRKEMLNSIDDLQQVIKGTLEHLQPEDLEEEFPIHVFKHEPPMSTTQMIMHLSTHLNYHLGQINYYRRLVTP